MHLSVRRICSKLSPFSYRNRLICVEEVFLRATVLAVEKVRNRLESDSSQDTPFFVSPSSWCVFSVVLPGGWCFLWGALPGPDRMLSEHLADPLPPPLGQSQHSDPLG